MKLEHGVYVRSLPRTFEGARVYVPSVTVWRDGQWLWATVYGAMRMLSPADAISIGQREAESFAADLPVIAI